MPAGLLNQQPEASKVEQLVKRQLSGLHREFPDQVARIDELGRAHLESLRAGATIEDFLPVLVYRFTRDDLRRVGSEPSVTRDADAV
jgi:hypothetical protein